MRWIASVARRGLLLLLPRPVLPHREAIHEVVPTAERHWLCVALSCSFVTGSLPEALRHVVVFQFQVGEDHGPPAERIAA